MILALAVQAGVELGAPWLLEQGHTGLHAGMPGVADVQDVFAQSGYQHMPLGEKQHGDEFVRVRMVRGLKLWAFA